jgi:hypothetical protein
MTQFAPTRNIEHTSIPHMHIRVSAIGVRGSVELVYILEIRLTICVNIVAQRKLLLVDTARNSPLKRSGVSESKLFLIYTARQQ